MERKNVYIYCRMACDNDKELGTQKKNLNRYAEEHGMTVYGISTETAGGRSLSRVGLNEVNKAVENGEIQYLLVKDISRLGRVMPQVMDYVDWLNSHGVELICADGTSYSVEESKVNDQINAEMSRLSV